MGTPERDLQGSSIWREGAGRLPGSRELELEQDTPPHPQKGPQVLAEGQSHCFRRPGKDREMGRERQAETEMQAETDRLGDTGRERNTGRDRDTGRETGRDRDRDRDTGRDRETETETQAEKGRESPTFPAPEAPSSPVNWDPEARGPCCYSS